MGEGGPPEDSLFPDLLLPDVEPGMGPDARRTARRAKQLAAGVHPATRQPLANNGEKCSGCVAFLRLDHHGRTYFKCIAAGLSKGAGTDIRASWPACRAFKPAGEWGPAPARLPGAATTDG